MTDEVRPDVSEPEAGQATLSPAGEGKVEEGQEELTKLEQTVELVDIGPCKKHIKVTVARKDIDRLMDKKFSKLVTDSYVAGFRPGKAPRQIVVRRFQKEVSQQIKAEVLLQSLEQLAEEHDVAPLTAPDINPNKIEIPKEGPLVYEFDVEVRPEFELPNYKGLKLRRVIRSFTEEDAAQEERRILGPYGQLVPKPEGKAQVGDYLITDLTTRHGDRLLSEHKEITVRIDPVLALKDGVCSDFGEKVKEVNAGESRTVEITLSDAVADTTLRGKKVEARFDVKDVKALRLPELTHDFLHTFGVHSPEQLRERIHVLLERRHQYGQRQSSREQVLLQIAAVSAWDLPRDLLLRQARRAMSRKVMEMQGAGMSDQEIRVRQRMLEQDIVRNTALSLKEHFVMQKIAELEKIEVDDDELEIEIERMAIQNDESPRRVRARLERDDLMEALATELIERKALDLILGTAEYEDVTEGASPPEPAIATVDEQAVPGVMKDPTVPLPEETPPAEAVPAAEAASGQ